MRHAAGMDAAVSGLIGLLLGIVALACIAARPAMGQYEMTTEEVNGSHGPLCDALGDTLPEGPWARRIVSLSPSLTEALFALGVAPWKIVGVTRYCDYPGLAKKRPQVGGIVDPSIERIQETRPDIVLVTRGNPIEAQEQLRDLGLRVFAFEDREGLEGLARTLSLLRAIAGSDDPEVADALLRRSWLEPRAYREWAGSIEIAKRPTVHFTDPGNPEFTAGPGSHIDDLILHAGGRNAVAEGAPWVRYSPEALMVSNPGYLLIAQPAGVDTARVLSGLRSQPAYAALPALRAGRVCWIPADELMRPGPRLLDALEKLASCLHPDLDRPHGPWKRTPLPAPTDSTSLER